MPLDHHLRTYEYIRLPVRHILQYSLGSMLCRCHIGIQPRHMRIGICRPRHLLQLLRPHSELGYIRRSAGWAELRHLSRISAVVAYQPVSVVNRHAHITVRTAYGISA